MRKHNSLQVSTVKHFACWLLLTTSCTSQTAAPTTGQPGQPTATGTTAAPSSGTVAGTGAPATPATPSQAAPARASGGTSAPSAPSPSAAAGSVSTTPNPTAPAPSAGAQASAGGAGSTAPVGGSAGATAASSTGGSAGVAATGGAAAPAMFKQGCKSGDLGPCSSFIPENGKELMLGSYGAVMERNVGKGFEYAVASGDSDDNSYCKGFTAGFGEDEASTEVLLDLGDLDMRLFTVYRPAQYPETKLPIITWGNGTCAKTEGYASLLRYVASHGFFVVAANSRFVGSGTPMKKGIDFALAANADMNSPYYQKLDPMKVGAMGHSQGGMGTLAVVKDERVQAVIIWNAAASASKPFLAVSGDTDVVGLSASSMRSAVSSAKTKGAFLYYHMVPKTGSASGHLTLMTQPERVVEPAVAFWKYILNGDTESQKYFAGAQCTLCNRATEFDFGQHGMD